MQGRKKRQTYSRQKDGKVWVPGVPAEEPFNSVWHFDGLPSALRSLFRFKGASEAFLDDIVFSAVMGQPFRFWFSHDFDTFLAYTFEESVPVILAKTFGFEYKWGPGGWGDVSAIDVHGHSRNLDKKAVHKAWAEIQKELDEGNPALVFGWEEKGEPRCGPTIITGYNTKDGLAYILPHATREPAPVWDDKEPGCRNGIKDQGYRARNIPDETNWYGNGYAQAQGAAEAAVSYFILKEQVEAPDLHQVVVASLQRAVGLIRGRLHDPYKPHRRGGLPALDLLAECLEREGEQYEYDDFKMPWDRLGETDWWYAMEAMASPLYAKTASMFLERCASGLGNFTGEQRILLWTAAGFYVAVSDHLGSFWDVFLSIGPLDKYEDRVATVNFVMSERQLRRRLAEIVHNIRKAQEKAVSFLERILVMELERPLSEIRAAGDSGAAAGEQPADGSEA